MSQSLGHPLLREVAEVPDDRPASAPPAPSDAPDDEASLAFRVRGTDDRKFRSSDKKESLDYDLFESKVNREAFRVQRDYEQFTRMRWFFTVLIGAMTALAATFIAYFSRFISEHKFTVVDRYMLDDRQHAAFFLLLATNAGCVALSAVLVAYVEPVAAGSGIPEIKVYLNGVKLPRVVRLRTLLVKMVGVTLSVGGALPIGKEGPMIHSGAVLGAGVSQGKSSAINMLACNNYFKGFFKDFWAFRNDREKRDFVACGTAAGVAAAFGAPIGGVMFALEEGASFWHPSLTFRAFVCAMVSMFTLAIADALTEGRSMLNMREAADFTFGTFRRDPHETVYGIGAIPIFVLLGVLGGGLGAIFNQVNIAITHLRRRHLSHRRWGKVIEALAVIGIATLLYFFMALKLGRCLPLPDATIGTELSSRLRRFNCGENKYNDMASLSLTEWDGAIKNLFHFGIPGTFSWQTLLLFFVVYFLLACYTYGLSVPSGLFIPSLLAGAAFGRLFAEFMHRLPIDNPIPDDGLYAFLGAAAMLGGMARMAISLTVILMESTGDIQAALPIMLTLVIARWVGNAVNHSLYDMHIHINNHIFLESFPPRHSFLLKVRDVMSKPVVVFREIETVDSLLRALHACEHNGFPVIRPDDETRRGRTDSAASAERSPWTPGRDPPAGDGLSELDLPTPRDAARRRPSESEQSQESSGEDEVENRVGGRASPGTVLRTGADVVPVDARQKSRGVVVAPSRRVLRSVSASGASEQAQRALRTGADPAHANPDGDVRRHLSASGARPSGGAAGSGSGRAARLRAVSEAEAEAEAEEAEAGRATGESVGGRPGAEAPGTRATASVAGSPNAAEAAEAAPGRGETGAALRERWLSGGGGAQGPSARADSAMFVDEDRRVAVATALAAAAADSGPALTSGRFGGIILRKHIATLLYVLFREQSGFRPDQHGVYGLIDRASFADLEHRYPRYPSVEDLETVIPQHKRHCRVDLRPYINRTPYTVFSSAPFPRAFTLMRGLGLRHVVVVDQKNFIRGIMTRKNLSEHHVDEMLARYFALKSVA